MTKVMSIDEISLLKPKADDVIKDLNKEIEVLKNENAELKNLINRFSKSNPDEAEQIALIDAETLCTRQIALLKERALVDELTLEECKKAEIYIKSLNAIKNVPKKIKDETKAITSNKLLELLKNSDSSHE